MTKKFLKIDILFFNIKRNFSAQNTRRKSVKKNLFFFKFSTYGSQV